MQTVLNHKAKAHETRTPRPGNELPAHKMPGHWLLASMGKRVLRPGGLQMTWALLDALDIRRNDHVVEFAPGVGVTAGLTLSREPASYTAVERDPAAAEIVGRLLAGPRRRCVAGSAEDSSLPTGSATAVYGEAMLSMQPATVKKRIIHEAARILRAEGRYGIHELCLVPDDLNEDVRQAIERELSGEIHMGVRPLTIAEWRNQLAAAGFEVVSQATAPMNLLEPRRIVQDEGIRGALRFAWNVATHATARQRVLHMGRIFRKYRSHLAAVALVSRKPAC